MKLLHYKNGNNICLAFKTENGVFDAALPPKNASNFPPFFRGVDIIAAEF